MSTPSFHFWGGNGWLQGKTVAPLAADTFEKLVASHFNAPHMLKVTRETFFSWPKTRRDKFKSGPYICACTFKEGCTERCDENADKIVLVCLDIDEAKFAKDFIDSPLALSDALYPHPFLAYKTANHTPEAPRLRIMVPIVPDSPTKLRGYVLHVANLIGMPSDWSGRRESMVVSQPMAKPVMFEGEEPSAMVASRTSGPLLEAMDIPATIEEEVQRTYGYKNVECELTSLPNPSIRVEDVRDALFTIDPDVGYREWCELLCSLRHNFREEEEAEEAFRMAVEWSSGGDKFKGEEDVYAKWKSFRPDFGGSRPITIKSLFKHAIDAGWKSNKLAVDYQKNVIKWIRECEEVELLMTEAHRRIGDMPFQNLIVENAMAQALRSRIKKLGGGDISLSKIETSIARARQATRAAEDDGNLPQWLRPFAYVSTMDVFHNTVTGVSLKPDAFNRTFGRELMPTNPEEESARTGMPVILPVNFALNVKNLGRADGLVYDPRKGSATEPFFESEGRRYVNEYRWSTVPAEDTRNADKALKIYLKHLETQFPGPENEEIRFIMLDWFAFLVQHPGEKMRWGPLVQGAQGCGKTFISRAVGAAIGHPNVKIANSTTLKGAYNDWAFGAQLCVIEEIWISGKGRMELMNSLKDIMADDQVTLNRKFHDTGKVENVTNFIAFSNHHNAITMEASDRRWFVLKSALQTKEQVRELTERQVGGMRYFDRMGLLTGKFGGALRCAIRAHEIRPEFNPNGHAPDTRWRRDMYNATKSPMLRRIEELIEDKHPMVQDDLIFYPELMRLVSGERLNSGDPDHYLPTINFHPWNGGQRYTLNGVKGQIWYNPQKWDEGFGDPYDEIRERFDEIPEENI